MNEVKKMSAYTYDLYDIGVWAMENALRPLPEEATLIWVGAEIVVKLYNSDLDKAYTEIVTGFPMPYELKKKLSDFIDTLNFKK